MSSIVKLAAGAVWTGFVIITGKNTGRGVVSNLLWWPGAVVAAVAESKLFGAA